MVRFMLEVRVKLSNRFRWVFCQLETLRHCLPASVCRTLGELPESLDETYERILKEIKKPNRDHARRLLQFLVVAVRPLRIEELAEVLAVDFDDAEGIPRLNASWCWEDQEQALLSSCSSLIAIVDSDYSRVVQFSHFSVKEYLASRRLLLQVKISPAIMSPSNLHIRSLCKLAWVFCCIQMVVVYTAVSETTLLLLGMPPDIGLTMPTARTRRGAFERRWNIYLTHINRNLGHGSSCTT